MVIPRDALAPYSSMVLQLWLLSAVRLRANEMEISAAQRASEALNELCLDIVTSCVLLYMFDGSICVSITVACRKPWRSSLPVR